MIIDQTPLPQIGLAAPETRVIYGAPKRDTQMNRDEMLLVMLEALVMAWLETRTAIEIGSDLDKVQLLKAVRAQVTDGIPSEQVRQLYQEVFLRDIWTGKTSGT